MDYSTDAMGNYMGDFSAVDPYAQETEEERRLRLQREAEAAAQAAGPVTAPVAPVQDKMQPVKQTITTDPRTGKQTMKIEGSVEDLSPANPNTPTVMPPNYDKMLQVESGNRDFDAQGRPITSPKGAMFKAQVMPATAQKPGFGIRPAADQTPAEYNRVGQEYYQAMLNKYPGQPELARAAYNAGPGAVDAAIKKSMMEGGSPIDYLPKETQGYVQKTGGNVRMQGGKLRVEPQAQQPQPQPQPAAEPVVTAQQLGSQQFPTTPAPAPAVPEPQSAYSLASGQPSQGLSVPGMAPVTEQPAVSALPEAQQRFQSIQDDPSALLQYRNDANVPEPLRRRAGERASELLNSERNLSRAEARRDELIASGDGKAIANAMQGRGAKGEEGNWLKFVFLHALDPNLANAEAEKLGILPSKFEQSTITNADGTQTAIEIKKSSSGKIQQAYRMDGTPLTNDELSKLNSGANLDIVGGTYVNDATGEVGRVVTDKKNPANSYVQTDKGRKPMTGFRPQSSGGSLEQQNATQQQQLMNKLHYEPAIAAASKGASTLAEYNALNGTTFAIAGRDSLGRPLLVDQRSNQMLQAPGQAPAPAPTAPAVQSTAPAVQSNAPVSPNAMPAVTGGTPAQRDAAKKQLEAEQQAARDVGTAEQKQFVEKVMPEIQKKGDDGKFIADTRRTQVGMLTGPNSAIMGIYRGSGTGYDKARAVIRDAVSGAYSGEEGGVKLSEDLRGISIPEEQLSALKEFTQLNTGINAKTLAENAGEGPKSDADMRLNQAANMTNIGDLPAFAALTGLTRSQFAGDINKRKQDFLNANRDQYKTQSQLEGAWGKEKDMLNRQYESIYRARLNYIDAQMVQKFGQDWRKKSNDDTQAFYRNASIHSFNVLPTPNYDTQTQKFVYPTQQSKIAAMRAITGK